MDPSGSQLTLIVYIVKAFDRHNNSAVAKDKEICISLINKLVRKLEPAELRERTLDAKDCWESQQ